MGAIIMCGLMKKCLFGVESFLQDRSQWVTGLRSGLKYFLIYILDKSFN